MLCINPIINTTPNTKNVNKRSNIISFKGVIPKDVLQIKNTSKNTFSDILSELVNKVLNINKKNITPEILKIYQSKFQSLFLREDISLEETKNIIKRYKSIEKTEDKIEYAKTFYEETKRNFGFENIDLPLRFQPAKKYKTGTSIGGAKSLMHEVVICPDIDRTKLPQIIFHELRHIKQNYYAANLDFRKYLNCIFNRLRPSLPENTTENDMLMAIYLTADKMVKRWGNFSPKNIPKQDMEYAKKCLNAHEHYISPKSELDEYLKNFLEQDAYGSELEFEKLYKKIKNSDFTEK